MSGQLLTGDRGRTISICVWFLPPPPPPHSGLTRQPQTTTILLHCRQETRVFIDLSLSFVIMNPTKQRVIKLGSSVVHFDHRSCPNMNPVPTGSPAYMFVSNFHTNVYKLLCCLNLIFHFSLVKIN